MIHIAAQLKTVTVFVLYSLWREQPSIRVHQWQGSSHFKEAASYLIWWSGIGTKTATKIVVSAVLVLFIFLAYFIAYSARRVYNEEMYGV